MKFSEEQKWQIISLNKQGYSRSQILRKLKELFSNIKFHLSFINRIIKNFKTTGKVSDLPRSGRPKSATNSDNTKIVKHHFTHRNKKSRISPSTRKAAARLNISRTSIQRILHDNLHFHAYRYHRVQELTDFDKKRRVICCNQFLNRFDNIDK